MAEETGIIRAYARAAMGRWAKAGWSAAKIRDRLRQRFGQAYRWQTLLADYREYKGMYANQEPLSRLKSDTVVPRTMMTEVSLRQNRKYRLIGEAEYFDKETGSMFTKMVSMYTDDRMSKTNWTSQYDDLKRIYQYQMGWDLVGIDWQVIEHNDGWDY